MMATDLDPCIDHACRYTDAILWDAFARANSKSPTAKPGSRIVFPRYRNGPLSDHVRISEQEARFAFVEALRQGLLHYYVETPTCKTYGFSGSRTRSAHTDLTIWDKEAASSLCNVECKCIKSNKRTSSIAKDMKESIARYMQKLMREPVLGLWFCLL